jgi:TonB family protein
VLHEVVPDVPAAARDKIRGRIHVTVQVVVDPDGKVVSARVEQAGPNKNFALLAKQAAQEWKFASTTRQLSRVWQVLFVFTRDGVTAQATAQ